MPRDDPVTECGIVGTVLVGDECIEFHERRVVEQQVEPLASRQLAAIVLFGDPFLTTTKEGRGAHRVEPLDPLIPVGHRSRSHHSMSLRKDRRIIAGR